MKALEILKDHNSIIKLSNIKKELKQVLKYNKIKDKKFKHLWIKGTI